MYSFLSIMPLLVLTSISFGRELVVIHFFISSSKETFETNLNDEFELNMAHFTVNHCTFSSEICHRLMSSNDISGKSLVTFR